MSEGLFSEHHQHADLTILLGSFAEPHQILVISTQSSQNDFSVGCKCGKHIHSESLEGAYDAFYRHYNAERKR